MFFNSVRSMVTACVAVLCLVGVSNSALGQARGEFAVFNAHDAESTTTHVYQDWDRFLRASVFDVGPSYRFRVSTRNDLLTGSRLGGGPKRSASWLEGNRVRYHLFKDEALPFLDDMKADMIASAEGGDIATWNRDEQLAFWLNMHNLLVMRVTVDRYPYRSAKKLHARNWSRDMVTIKGVSLSIRDIEDQIILAIWDDPMVIYGLYQGAIGGPSLRPLALQGKTVALSLQKNGDEFVNSYRGVHSRGKYAEASKFYRWTERAFPDFEADLRRHLLNLADEKTADILNRKSSLKTGYFSWTVPDFFSGKMTSDFGTSSMSAVTALSGVGANNGGEGNFAVTSTFGGLPADSAYYGGAMPIHTLQFLTALRRKFKAYNMPNMGITNGEMVNGKPMSGRTSPSGSR